MRQLEGQKKGRSYYKIEHKKRANKITNIGYPICRSICFSQNVIDMPSIEFDQEDFDILYDVSYLPHRRPNIADCISDEEVIIFNDNIFDTMLDID